MSLAAAGTQETPGIRPCQKFEGHTNWVTDVIHLPDEQQIMTSSYNKSLRVWNLQSGEQTVNDRRDAGRRIALSPDGKKVVSGGLDNDLKLWDIKTSKVIAEWTGRTGYYVKSVCWSQDGGRVMSGYGDRTARVWDVESGKTVLAIDTGLATVEAVIYSPDTTMIGTGGINGEENEFLKIWDAETGRLITNLKGHTEKVFCLAWTADGSTLVSASYDYSIRIWNTTTWEQTRVLTGHTGAVRGVAISPNGLILASASWDDTARLWNLENGLPVGSPLQHPDHVQCVSFSTDGKLLATGCWDNNAYSWDISGILEEAGLLNPAGCDKLLINADAARHPGDKRKDVLGVLPRFFDDAVYHPDSSRCLIPPSSARQHDLAVNPSSHRHPLLGRISSSFLRNRNDTHDTMPQPRFLQSVRSMFALLPHGNYEGVQLRERRLAVVDVPFTRGKPRNYSVGELRRKEEKEKQKAKEARNTSNTQNMQSATNVSGGSPPPARSIATQQSRGAAHDQPSLQMHPTVSTLSTIPAVAATSAATIPVTPPSAIIPGAGRWTRFWLLICCTSAQYTDGHN